MTPQHPCPNCGKLRSGPAACCADCLYPKHKRQLEDLNGRLQLKHPSFQFHIRTLLGVTTAAAIVCGITTNWGLDGLWLAVRILAFLFPALEFFYYFWINVLSSEANAIDEYESRFR